jgi:translation elongation factor EF-Tu-like GTPase
MSQPRFGVTLDIHLDVRATDAGGRSLPIVDGYRPLCIVGSPDGETVVGLCELHLDNPISPGESGVGRLSFDLAVSESVRALLNVGSTFALAEGRRVVAAAEVQGIGP